MSSKPVEFYAPGSDIINAHLNDAPNLEHGSQSRISLFELDGISEAVLLKRMGVGKGLDYDEVSHLHDDLLEYRQQLSDASWNVPHLNESALVNTDSEWQIWGIEDFITGTNAAQIFKHPTNHTMKLHVIKQVLSVLSGYQCEDRQTTTLYDRSLPLLPHGVDLKPSNIIIDNLGFMWMVDTFGPKTINQKGNLSSYNHKLERLGETAIKALCVTRQGAMLRFLRSTQELWLDSDSSDKEAYIEDLESAMAFASLPEDESQTILSEIDQGYPWLNKIYGADPS